MHHFKDEETKRAQIVSIAKRMNCNAINQGTSGNISVRFSNGMLITPSSIPYEEMQPSDIVALDLNGDSLVEISPKSDKKKLAPSSEWQIHASILKHRPTINAVFHCHSIHATALACHGRSIPSFHYMTAVGGGHDIRCATYSTFGTTELSQKVIEALRGRYACLLAQHGQITIATSLEKAYRLAIEVETLAHMYLLACKLGEPNHLSREEMNLVLNKFQTMNYFDS